MLFAGIGVVLDGTLILFFEGMVPRFRARVTFGRTDTCRRWRQVRDLMISQAGRPIKSHRPPCQRQRG